MPRRLRPSAALLRDSLWQGKSGRCSSPNLRPALASRSRSASGSSAARSFSFPPARFILAAAKLDFELRIAAPRAFQPSAALLQRAGGRVVCTEDIKVAASSADALYTDVWVSMGKEAESAERIELLRGYQINSALLKLA